MIPEVEVRIRPAPESRRYEAWIIDDFEAGSEVIRSLAQRDRLPAIARVSDPDETAVSMGISGPTGLAGDAFNRYLKLRGKGGGSLMIVGLEGGVAEVRQARRDLARSLRAGGAMSLGRSAGQSWSKGRFHGPYLREALLDRGLVVDTLETAQQWSRHRELYDAVKGAIERELDLLDMTGVVMCHLSHAYRDGASLYFTVIASPGSTGRIESWMKIKAAASLAIQATGGTLSHHHATGRDHLPWLDVEIGPLGIETLRSAKATFDPEGIMNPGCLVPEG
jgi:alkyldihydroxyacetonephosphate synthase